MSQQNETEPETAGDDTTLAGRPENEEEEEEIWVPLSMTDEDSDFVGVKSEEDQPRSTAATTGGASRPRIPSTSFQQNKTSNNKSSKSLQLIQRKLETKISIQNNLVNHPIDLFWKRLLINLLREIWTLEVRIRSGLLLLVLGLLTRLFVFSFWYLLYPRVAILSLAFLAGFIYLDPFDLQTQGKNVLEALLNPEKAIQAIEKLNIQHIRRLAVVLFLFPTFLEVRTLWFLSEVSAETKSTGYHIAIGAILLGAMLYLFHHKRMNPRDATYQGMLIAYGSSLVVCLSMFHIRRMPFLAAPFLTATGTLLLTYQDDDMEWMSRVVRHALRVSLKDVLASVGSRVSEDEMLQLAILRWISDFWANNPGTPPPPTSSTPPTASTANSSSQYQASGDSSQLTHRSPTTENENSRTSPQSRPNREENRPPSSQPQRDVQWEELLPMLNIEIDHMEDEAETLQADRPHQEPPPRPNPNSHQPHRPQQSSSPDQFEDLKNMLMSLSVDERAKPAVEAYRRAVVSFPPPKRLSVILSVVRRCPAAFALVLKIFFGGPSHWFSSFMFLSPFVVMEYYRILHWIVSCHQVVNVAGEAADVQQQEDWVIPKDLKNVDTMTILLCGDNHSALRPPTLLRVWHNIVSSVSALEVGLTAARCAETTAVAADFAGNVMSLVQFGFEVAEHGLLHGLGVVVKEAIYMGGDFSNLDQMDHGSVRYTKAAIHAVQSGHRVAKNVHALSADEHVGAFVQPVLGTLGAIIGHGWLWGKDDAGSGNSPSTVVIEEIHEVINSNESDQCQNRGDKDKEVPANLSKLELSLPDPARPPSRHEDSQCNTGVATTADSTSSDELSEVMEMVAVAYERNLIEDDEKADFYEKLSSLKEEELSDPSVVASMKRTLEIILENGVETSLLDASTTEDMDIKDSRTDIGSEADQPECLHEPVTELPRQDSETFQLEETESMVSPPVFETVEQNQRAPESTPPDNSNEALLKFGAAALVGIAGGVLLSMAGQGGEGRRSSQRDETWEEAESENHAEGNQSSAVVIEELSDDDDEWVSVPQ